MMMPRLVAEGRFEFQVDAVDRNVPPFRNIWRNVVPFCAPRTVLAPFTKLASSTPPLTKIFPVKVLAALLRISLPAPVLVRPPLPLTKALIVS